MRFKDYRQHSINIIWSEYRHQLNESKMKFYLLIIMIIMYKQLHLYHFIYEMQDSPQCLHGDICRHCSLPCIYVSFSSYCVARLNHGTLSQDKTYMSISSLVSSYYSN